MLGYYPVRVLPSKTAILPVNPTFLPRVWIHSEINVLPVLLAKHSLMRLLICVINSLKMREKCVPGLSTVQTLIKRCGLLSKI